MMSVALLAHGVASRTARESSIGRHNGPHALRTMHDSNTGNEEIIERSAKVLQPFSQISSSTIYEILGT